jgi:hypothetical protein
MRDIESYQYWRSPLLGQVRRTYTRVGTGPAWSSAGPHLLQLRSVRGRSLWTLPRGLRTLVRAELPAWRRAPAQLGDEEGA